MFSYYHFLVIFVQKNLEKEFCWFNLECHDCQVEFEF